MLIMLYMFLWQCSLCLYAINDDDDNDVDDDDDDAICIKSIANVYSTHSWCESFSSDLDLLSNRLASVGTVYLGDGNRKLLTNAHKILTYFDKKIVNRSYFNKQYDSVNRLQLE